MATKSVGRKAPARAPVAPTTTPPATPATPETAQAQAVALLTDAATRLKPAFNFDDVTTAVRLSRLASGSVKHMLGILALPLTSGFASDLIAEAFDFEALLEAACGLDTGPHCEFAADLIGVGEEVARLMDRLDWPEAEEEPEAQEDEEHKTLVQECFWPLRDAAAEIEHLALSVLQLIMDPNFEPSEVRHLTRAAMTRTLTLQDAIWDALHPEDTDSTPASISERIYGRGVA